MPKYGPQENGGFPLGFFFWKKELLGNFQKTKIPKVGKKSFLILPMFQKKIFSPPVEFQGANLNGIRVFLGLGLGAFFLRSVFFLILTKRGNFFILKNKN